MANHVSRSGSLLAYLATGLVSAVLCRSLIEFWPSDILLQSLSFGVVNAVLTFAVLVALVMHDGLYRSEVRRVLVVSIAVLAMASWEAWLFLIGPSVSTDFYYYLPLWLVCLVTFLFILLPFIQASRSHLDDHYHYHNVFTHAWDNVFVLLTASSLTGLFWLIVMLWVRLFEHIGVYMLRDFVVNSIFPWLTLPVVFILGIHVGCQNRAILDTLRSIILSLSRYLLPLSAVMMLIFTVSVCWVGLQSLMHSSSAISIMLGLVFAFILFLNCVLQSGLEPDDLDGKPYHPLIARLLDLATLLMIFLSGLALYSVLVRIDAYGLTPLRFYAVLLSLFALAYSLAYGLAVLQPQRFGLALIQQSNVVIAIIFAGVILLVRSPLLSPSKFSADSQYLRLINEEVAVHDFDFGYLKFKLGPYGLERLGKLRDLPASHPYKTDLTAVLTHLDQVDSYYRWTQLKSDSSHDLPDPSVQFANAKQGEQVPDGFINSLDYHQCRNSTCFISLVNLDKDKAKELILFESEFSYGPLTVYKPLKGKGWRYLGTLGGELSVDERESVLESMKKGRLTVKSSRYQSLKIGQKMLSVQE